MKLPLLGRPGPRTAKPAESPAIVVGLRNPGSRYEGSRHNIGSVVLARLAERNGHALGRAPSRVSAAMAKIGTAERPALLLAPLTYMNESGRVVRAALDYWKVPPDDLLVIHDDIDLAFGRLRLQVGGGSGGHNGIRSVEGGLGTKDFSRLKVGVGRPPGSMDPADFVLRPFGKKESAEVELMVEDAVEVVETWLTDRRQAQEMAAHRGREE